MKSFILVVVALSVGGCVSSKNHSDNAVLRSERDYAVKREALANDLYRTGQVLSIEAARAQATAEVNQEWAHVVKAAEQRKNQEKFEKDLSKVGSDSK